MKAHQTYHVKTLHLVACDVDLLVEFIVEIEELRRIVLDIELLKLDVGVKILNVLFGGNVTRFFEKCALNRDTEESGFLYEFIVDERYAAALLGKDVNDLGLR